VRSREPAGKRDGGDTAATGIDRKRTGEFIAEQHAGLGSRQIPSIRRVSRRGHRRIIGCMFARAELAGFLILLTALTPVLGGYLARVFEGPPGGITRLGRPFEQRLLRICRVDPAHEMSWPEYLSAVLIFSAVSAAALFALLCTQARLPLNPQHFPNLAPVLAFTWRSAS
jgi:hypothetical protein